MSNQAWFNLHKCISEAHRLHSGHVFVGRRSACWEGCCLRAQGWQKTAVLCNCHRLWPHVHEPEQRRYFKLIFLIDVGSTWRKMFDLMGGLNRIFKFSLMMPNDPAVGPICGFFQEVIAFTLNILDSRVGQCSRCKIVGGTGERCPEEVPQALPENRVSLTSTKAV